MNHPRKVFASLTISLALVSPPFLSGGTDTNPRPHNSVTPVVTTNPRDKNATLLRELPNGYFAIPWLTSRNVEKSVAEINRRKIKRVHLGPIDESNTQSKILRQIYTGCPHLTALGINDWTLTTRQFRELLESLKEVSEIQLDSCRFATEPSHAKGGFESIVAKPLMTRLSLNSCRKLSNRMVGGLLKAFPNLEHLSLSDSDWTGSPFDGADWPLQKLKKLKEFSISANINDQFVRRLIDEVPGLRSLTLEECPNVTGKEWASLPSVGIEVLGLSRCEMLSDKNVSSFLKHTPRLKSLRIRRCPGIRIGGLDLGGLGFLRQLELRAYGQQRLETGEMGLTQLSNLRNLEIRGLQLNGDPIVQALRTMKKLESLALSSVFPVNEPKFSFANQTELKHLSINVCAVQPDVLATLPMSLQTVHFQNCRLSNSSVPRMLKRLSRLETLRLDSIDFDHGIDGKRKATAVSGWDFSLQKQLVRLELGNCPDVTDELVASIAEQVQGLESLRVAYSRRLSGKDWNLDRLSHLQKLELIDLGELTDTVIGNLPKSLKSIRVVNCPKLTGQDWDLAALSALTHLDVSRCKSLKSIGTSLPKSIQELRVFECIQLVCRHLDYSGVENLEKLSFKDCRNFDVDRLFAKIPKYAKSIRRIDLSGCPNLTSSDWDLSPLKHTLQRLLFPEGEPSYVGGIDEVGGRRLQQQLPDTRIVR